MPANRVQKRLPKRSSTQRRQLAIDYIDLFGFDMPACSRCTRLSLSCKASDRGSSCDSCLKANASPCDVFGAPISVLRSILDEKRRLDREKRDTMSKLLRLEAQSRALEGRAVEAFSREIALLEEESRASVPESSSAGLVLPAAGSPDLTGLSDVDWSAFGFDLVPAVDPGFGGGTAGASPGNSGSQEVPTS